MAEQPLSAAERLRARITASNIPDHRPAWLLLVDKFEQHAADSPQSETHTFAESLVMLAEGGAKVPGELLIMARAYLQPRYRDDRDRARTHDPTTSQQAANTEARKIRSRTHAHRLLEAYSIVAGRAASAMMAVPYYGGLTAPEAALMIGKPGAWRRTPELHQDGLIEIIPWREYTGPPIDVHSGDYPEMPATRLTVYGQQARVFRITDAGREELKRMNREERAWIKARDEKAARKAARGNKA